MQSQPSTLKRARRSRQAMTKSETILWQALRAGRLGGRKFRRQHPVGTYVLDFYCDAARLAVEVDGGVHEWEDRQLSDAVRDAWLAQRGVRTLRLPARLVEENTPRALEMIVEALDWRAPSGPPR